MGEQPMFSVYVLNLLYFPPDFLISIRRVFQYIYVYFRCLDAEPDDFDYFRFCA